MNLRWLYFQCTAGKQGQEAAYKNKVVVGPYQMLTVSKAVTLSSFGRKQGEQVALGGGGPLLLLSLPVFLPAPEAAPEAARKPRLPRRPMTGCGGCGVAEWILAFDSTQFSPSYCCSPSSVTSSFPTLSSPHQSQSELSKVRL